MKYREGIKRLLSLAGWKQFFKLLKKKEKIIFFIFLFIALISFVFLCANFYLKNTEIKPTEGGTHTEGVAGFPRFINPVYAPAYDVDRDLTELIYSGLMKYNEKGEIVPDLAKDYQTLEQGKVFEFYLKEDLFWSDGVPLTADDVIFTVKSIQNPSLKSPIRASWLGVKTEKISDSVIRFELESPSAVFLENSTLKIMPQHIWEEVPEQNFPFSDLNLNPIGSGPYQIKETNRDNQGNISFLELVTNPNYHGNIPYISKIIFSFFASEDELVSAFNSNRINGFSLNSPEKYQNLRKRTFSEHRFLMPRYFAVFFNPEKSENLENKKIREALSYGTDKKEIISQTFLTQGKITDSPILPHIYGFENPSKAYQFDLEKAKQILDEAGFVQGENGFRKKTTEKKPGFTFESNLEVGSKGNEVEELQKCLARDPDVYPEGEVTGYFGEKTKSAVIKFQEKYKQEILSPYDLTAGTGRVLASTQSKLNQICAPVSEEVSPLAFSLTTVNQPTLMKVADNLKEQWQRLGIKTEIEYLERSIFTEEIIRPRNYQMILFGQGMGMIIDPFPFWHSSQIRDPGLNLALFENTEADEQLEEARCSLDQEERQAALEKFQDILTENIPAIFLYSPDHIYLVSEEVKGIPEKTIIDPSKRFINIEDWYIKTKRVWK